MCRLPPSLLRAGVREARWDPQSSGVLTVCELPPLAQGLPRYPVTQGFCAPGAGSRQLGAAFPFVALRFPEAGLQ